MRFAIGLRALRTHGAARDFDRAALLDIVGTDKARARNE
jgi:hypothetical protein